jgi:hypothetical protein
MHKERKKEGRKEGRGRKEQGGREKGRDGRRVKVEKEGRKIRNKLPLQERKICSYNFLVKLRKCS